jgi:hypothetical protein
MKNVSALGHLVVRVGEVMRKDVSPIPSEMSIGELAERTAGGGRNENGNAGREPGFNRMQGLPIADRAAGSPGL